MKYLTEINWGKIDYVAPAGYYFLNLGDDVIEGDGFLKPNGIENYFILNHKIEVKGYHIYPSVRPIPVEKAPAPAPAKLEYKQITDITPGDLFIDPIAKRGYLIIQCVWETDKYSLSGHDGLNNYFNHQEITKEIMINYLNKHKRILICNINDKIKKTIEAASKMI